MAVLLRNIIAPVVNIRAIVAVIVPLLEWKTAGVSGIMMAGQQRVIMELEEVEAETGTDIVTTVVAVVQFDTALLNIPITRESQVRSEVIVAEKTIIIIIELAAINKMMFRVIVVAWSEKIIVQPKKALMII